MRHLQFTSALALLISAALSGCAGDGSQEPTGSSGGKADGVDNAVVIEHSDDGETIAVAQGQDIVVRLPSNASAGYEWLVVATNRTFGYPAEENYIADSDRAGSAGVAELIWKTDGVLSMAGEHTVVLEYRRPWEEYVPATETFTFTVDIVADDSYSVEIDSSDDGTTIQVVEGQDIVVRLPSNPTTGYQWEVVSTSRTFGYPESIDYVADSEAVGGSGTTEMTWKSVGFQSMVGTHTVELEYRRSWEPDPPAAESFSFTVEIIETP